jgi:hypothetical protein
MSASKNTARARVAGLVRNFQRNEADYLRTNYNETQARTDFITPLLEAFGWDVHNVAGQSSALREVIEEATVEVGEERLSKKPDYELRLARQRKLFVEAKKPSVRIERDRAPAFQTRRYGYSASLPVSILTNFHHLAVYDCKAPPVEADEAHVSRFLLLSYDEFETRFDELWPLLSREAVYSGDFDRRFAVDVTRRGAEQFDDFFLRQVRSWRQRLAMDIHANVPSLTPTELTYAVQLFLSRIVFLRICEDREIERYETLRRLPAANTFVSLMAELRRADAFYDSGLFRLLDDARLGIRISDAVLLQIIAELYYPQSPYTFAVVETQVLGEIYEQFLGEVIAIAGNSVEIAYSPEVRESGGVVPTPQYIVDAIVERTLVPALSGKGPDQLQNFTVADICCGSGIFLLAVYEFLLDHYLTWYLSSDRPRYVGITIYEVTAGQWRLTYEERRRILLQHVRGVDIDANAVDVARFSLLLKLIEHESAIGLNDYVNRLRTPALPVLDATIRTGNSLVSYAEWTSALGAMSPALSGKVLPFDWATEFPEELERGGFNVIVGNPPYIRIQNMTAYSPEEVTFFRSEISPYSTARQDTFDKYTLFIERALTLLSVGGRLGVIVPHKFMTIRSGRPLRRLISTNRLLEEVVHFGVKQVFGRNNVTNYTCILVLNRNGRESVRVEHAGPLEGWRYGASGARMEIPSTEIGEDAWQFADHETRAIFDSVRASFPNQLSGLADIFVGVQNSADAIYIFRSVEEDADTVTLRWDERDWPIERGILRPCLHDVQLFAYTRPNPNAWMIFPYTIVAGAARTKARLFQPQEMANRFPGCMAYLTARRAELEARNIAGGSVAEKQFYQFGRSQSLTKFHGPKIILPILSLEPRYAYDDRNILVTGGGNGPYYMVRHKPGMRVTNYFLLAVLNHPLSEAFVRTKTTPFRGGYYSHGKQWIENLPIPLPSEQKRLAVETLVAEVIDVMEAISEARTPHQRVNLERSAIELRTRIENKITDAFGLSSSEMEIVRAVPVPE